MLNYNIYKATILDIVEYNCYNLLIYLGFNYAITYKGMLPTLLTNDAEKALQFVINELQNKQVIIRLKNTLRHKLCIVDIFYKKNNIYLNLSKSLVSTGNAVETLHRGRHATANKRQK